MENCTHPKIDATPLGTAHALGRIEGTVQGVVEWATKGQT